MQELECTRVRESRTHNESSVQLATQQSAICALQQQRSRHALDVRDWLMLARLGDSSMQPALQRSAACALQQQCSRHALNVRD